MAVKAYNFSKIDTREKRFYSISDVQITKVGIPYKLLGISAILIVISLLINVPIGLFINIWYFFPLTAHGEVNTWGILFTYGLPVGIAAGLYYLRFYNYRLIDLLLLLFKRRPEISINGKRITHTLVKFRAFLER